MSDEEKTDCPDCGVVPGQRHQGGCDVERCPLCKMQLISCGCIYEVNGMDRSKLDVEHPAIYVAGPTEQMYVAFDAEVERRGGYTIWTGEWPGLAECRELGWFCQDGFGSDAQWGSFCPCPRDAPGARPDLNRLVHFYFTGKDTMYDGCPRVPRSV